MADDGYEYVNETLIDPSLICIICCGPFNDPYSTKCKHIYCRGCINSCLQRNNTCCICRRPIKRTDLMKAEAICEAVNQLLVICKKCNQNMRRGQFNEHIRNNCSGTQSNNPIDINLRQPILNPERIESLVNQPLRQCQQLREELKHQRIEINNNYNHTNNNVNTINGKLKEQKDELEILRKSNAIQQRKIQELERCNVQIGKEKIEQQERLIDQLTTDNLRLQNHIKHLNNQSNESESRLQDLENKINQLLPYNNDELEDYITENCEFGSEMALCATGLVDRDMEIIVKRVIINRQCSELDLRRNHITSQGVLILADVFHRDIRLKFLDLSYNNITDNGIQYLTEGLLQNTTLKELNLGSTGIKNQGIKYLTELLKINATLKKLQLYENKFDDIGMKLLTNILTTDNHTLVELSVRSNLLITDESIYSIMDMFKENGSLSRIDIDQCNFSNGAKTRLRDAAENVSITIEI